MENKITKKSPIGGSITSVVTRDPITGKSIHVEMEEMADYSPEKVKADLAKYGVEAVKEVEVVDPITQKRSIVTIDRTGTHEGKLILALADPKLSRDQKDFVLSMYLFERGKENASMLVDLMRYKGEHTKETRAFTSQMRFDFEMFIKLFVEQMRAVSRDISKIYGIENLTTFCLDYLKVLEDARKNNQEPDLGKFLPEDKADRVAILTMIRNFTEAEQFESRMGKITESRMKEKGFGIYINAQGRPYSIFTDDKVDEIVKADQDRIKDLKESEQKI